jgi:hypothetical protein
LHREDRSLALRGQPGDLPGYELVELPDVPRMLGQRCVGDGLGVAAAAWTLDATAGPCAHPLPADDVAAAPAVVVTASAMANPPMPAPTITMADTSQPARDRCGGGGGSGGAYVGGTRSVMRAPPTIGNGSTVTVCSPPRLCKSRENPWLRLRKARMR